MTGWICDDEVPVLCTGTTHDSRPCGNRPINGSDRCSSHQRKEVRPEFIPSAIKHGGSGVIPRTVQELTLLSDIDYLGGFDLANAVAIMQVRRLTKKTLLEPELREANELLQTITHERGLMQGQQFSRTVQERPDLEKQLDKALNTLVKVSSESAKQNQDMTVEEKAKQLKELMASPIVQPVDLNNIPGGDSDLFAEDDDV